MATAACGSAPQSVELTAALEARAKLAVAASAAKRQGRPRDWFVGRPASAAPFVGLRNEGATCYLNSLLQGLFMLPEVRKCVYAFEYDEARHGAAETCVPYQLARLFTAMQRSSRQALSTKELTASFGWSAAESFRQHDVQELCSVLFDALGKFGVPLRSLFDGALRNSVHCLECGYESRREEAFVDLPLDVAESADVGDALRRLVAWELMEGEGSWKVASAGDRTPDCLIRRVTGSHA